MRPRDRRQPRGPRLGRRRASRWSSSPPYRSTSTRTPASTSLRRIFFRRASQNVVSPGRRPGRRRACTSTAHYDAAKSGCRLRPALRPARPAGSPSRPASCSGPIRLVFWAAIVLLPLISGLRMAGVDAGWLDVVQLGAHARAVDRDLALLVDIALSAASPAPTTTPPGSPTVLSVAAALDDDPPRTSTSGSSSPAPRSRNAAGHGRYVAAHRKELDRERPSSSTSTRSRTATSATCLRGGDRQLRDGPRLIELCEAIAAATETGYDAPIRIPLHTDALPARARGFRATRSSACDDGVDAALLPHAATTPRTSSTRRR